MSAVQEPVSDLLFTTDDLMAMPDDGKLYEIIEGELYVHEDELTSPLLPGFSCKVSTLFMQIPPAPKA
ncbi:MAG TPA: hypothetical protein VI479_14700 [Blastocatellia bacterium]